MPHLLKGTASLVSAQTSASQDDWSGIIYPEQVSLSYGDLLHSALELFSDPVVALVNVPFAVFIATTDSATADALRALVPAFGAFTIAPVAGQQSASLLWEPYGDQTYQWAGFDALLTPQLFKRSVWAMLSIALSKGGAPCALVDQAAGRITFFDDYSGVAPSITPAGQTVCATIRETRHVGARLMFEGGPTT